MATLHTRQRAVCSAALGLVPFALLSMDARAAELGFGCDGASSDVCTLTIAPAGGAGATLSAAGTQFQARLDGTGFDISGTVQLGGTSAVVPGVTAQAVTLYEAALVAEFANPAAPEEGFRRLRGTGLMRRAADAEADPGFGMFNVGAGQEFRVDIGLELGTVLQQELAIQHLNPARPCEGREPGDAGYRECPYWVFRVVDEKSIGAGFGGTDVGLNMTAGTSSSNNVTFLMDPDDFFVYVGYSTGAMDSVTLRIEPTAGENDPGDPLMNNDNGIGFSQHAYIPFSPRTTYGIESEIEALGLDFQGHLVIDKNDIPVFGGMLMDGSLVFKFPLDELTGDARFDNHWQAAGNGDLKVKVPLFTAVTWEMAVGNATAGGKVTSDQQHAYLSGDIDKDFPWKPEGLPLSMDYRNNYQVAAVFVNNVDPQTAVPYLDVSKSFLQMEGEYLVDFSLGNPSSELGVEIYSNGFLRADPMNGIEFWGDVGRGGSATMIHPLIQTGTNARLSVSFDPTRPSDAQLEVVGAFTVGGETFSQQARLLVTPEEGYLGFPLSFDPELVLQAYNDIQDATRDAEAEVQRLNAEIDRQRAIVQAERDAQQAAIDAAQRDVNAAQAEVNSINNQISQRYGNISYYKGRISYWYRWYQNQPWYKKATAYATYLSKKAYYNALIAAEYTAIGALEAARAVATAALDVARAVLQTAIDALDVTPIDLDPRVGPVILARDVALAVLNSLQEAMPEIPEIPGTIEATAGFRIDGNGLTAESRATYCENGECTEIRGGTYDRAAGRACITLPNAGNERVCTAIPSETI